MASTHEWHAGQPKILLQIVPVGAGAHAGLGRAVRDTLLHDILKAEALSPARLHRPGKEGDREMDLIGATWRIDDGEFDFA